MSEVRRWLEGIGFSQYADAFRANDIDLLRQVDDQMLKDIGISTGGTGYASPRRSWGCSCLM
jgi:hypothetical protein